MRESFVFHAEYIDDLPSQYKAEFMQYTVDYGLYGKTPPLSDDTLESALWAKIKRRIDKEAEKYEAISNKRREAAQKRYAQRYDDKVKAQIEPTKNANAEIAESEQATENKKNTSKSTRFEKPTVEEISTYCKERKNDIDAQAFFDFYESKGWKVGSSKMQDWKASVRTWEQRHREERHKPTGVWGKENEIPDEITDLF